ncbi:MAG: galactokinase [Rubrivivax sp.]
MNDFMAGEPLAGLAPHAGLNELARRAREALQSLDGIEPAGYAQAPGRVNLIGEHTDYNDGFVLPCTLDRGVMTAWAPRGDRRLRVCAADAAGQTTLIDLDAPPPPDMPAWARYVHAMATVMDRHHPDRLQGASLGVAGNVPSGAGLSSSAALLLSVGHALAAASGRGVDPITMALWAQRAENDHVGCQCGIMDPLVSASGQADHALFIDCRTLQRRPVALPSGIGLLIAHSRVRRELVDSAYNDRRRACEAAAAALGVIALRDATAHHLETALARGALSPLLERRARHVVSENGRTIVAAQALASGDLPALGALMQSSHRSLRDDFEVSVPAMDQLVEQLQHAIGRDGGARMTGGGFGGCAVAVMPADRLAAVAQQVATAYRSPQGLPPTLLAVRPGPGAGPWRGVAD